jgi:hypothetical protein
MVDVSADPVTVWASEWMGETSPQKIHVDILGGCQALEQAGPTWVP